MIEDKAPADSWTHESVEAVTLAGEGRNIGVSNKVVCFTHTIGNWS